MKLTLHESQAGIGKTRLGRAQERSEMVEQNKPSGDSSQSQRRYKNTFKSAADWFMVLQDVARFHGVYGLDRGDWCEDWEKQSPEDAFFTEYPEYAPYAPKEGGAA